MGLDTRVSGRTKLTGLIGNPMEHTVSPVLQNSLFSMMGIDGIYIPIRVPGGKLEEALRGLSACGFSGLNVTIPYKEEILQYLDEISEEAVLLGAANTIRFSDGKLYGYNTDGEGFMRAFTEQTGENFKDKNVCIIGAGGTARALSVKIAAAGAERITIINRTPERAQELSNNAGRLLRERGLIKTTLTPLASESGDAAEELEKCDIIINTTPAGMYPNTDCSPLKDDFRFRSEQTVYDVIYNPAETKLLAQAKKYGCRTANGAAMLFYQGVRAFEIWTETEIPKQKLKDLSCEFIKYLSE